VITHIPVLCEDNDVPYIYVTSRAELGGASTTKRPTSVVLVKPHADGDELYDECCKKVAASGPVF
jgi:H/ACA ribonucleoprotein complex subunit 2